MFDSYLEAVRRNSRRRGQFKRRERVTITDAFSIDGFDGNDQVVKFDD